MAIVSTVAVSMTVTMDWRTADHAANFIAEVLSGHIPEMGTPPYRAAVSLMESIKQGQAYLHHFQGTEISNA